MRMVRAEISLRLLLLAAVLCCAPALAAQQEETLRGKVVAVDDGNTVVVQTASAKLRIRLAGVGVPTQAFATESREHLSRLLDGKEVEIVTRRVKLADGRREMLAGKIVLASLDAGLEQVGGGYAWLAGDAAKYQSEADLRAYAEAQRRAIETGRGVWGASSATCPNAAVKTTIGEVARADAKSAGRIFGTVVVEVTIGLNGDVLAARALCGHPVLQTAAVDAVMRGKFQRQTAKITGNIVFNFAPQ